MQAIRVKFRVYDQAHKVYLPKEATVNDVRSLIKDIWDTAYIFETKTVDVSFSEFETFHLTGLQKWVEDLKLLTQEQL